MPRPRVTTTPKRPPPTIATSSTILTQKNKAGGARRGFLCDVCVSRYSDGKGRGAGVRGVDTGMRGKEGIRTGRVSTILCQFLFCLVSLLSLISSSILSARSIDTCATAILPLFREERDERCTNFTVSEERSAAETSASFS